MASRDVQDKVWNKAKRVSGKDPAKYRWDPNRIMLFRQSYGKNSEMGWEIDHIKPKSRGGSDATSNLQAVSTRINRQNGATLRKRSRHSKRNK